ncbi:MAG TPA: PPC domain-containing protein [Longimicrobium sp.]|nr:PPC domain-containing protein [Longimicrobium sp.]
MYRALHLASLLLLAAAPAAAQDLIRPGESVAGQLSESDPTLDDGSHYDVWRFAAQARHRYRVTLRSDDFDAYLSVGSNAVDECEDCASDDDGAGGTDALVEFTGSADGTYVIRANSYDEGEVGDYQLSLEDAGVVEEGHEAHGPDEGAPITAGVPETGTLARGDRKMDNSYMDTWTYHGRRGETIVVTVRSEDFDTFVTLGEYEGGECRGMDGNDNGGGGTDSRITTELPNDGAFHIHVRSAGQGETGTYTVLVERVTDRESGAPPMPISPGETLEGRLSDTDSREADGSYREDWTFRGDAGATYVVTMRSDDFDSLLQVGTIGSSGWRQLEQDDDGGGDSDAQLTITLPSSGEFIIRAGSYRADETGAYTMRLERR